jgi:hypothetical protein
MWIGFGFTRVDTDMITERIEEEYAKREGGA